MGVAQIYIRSFDYWTTFVLFNLENIPVLINQKATIFYLMVKIQYPSPWQYAGYTMTNITLHNIGYVDIY